MQTTTHAITGIFIPSMAGPISQTVPEIEVDHCLSLQMDMTLLDDL